MSGFIFATANIGYGIYRVATVVLATAGIAYGVYHICRSFPHRQRDAMARHSFVRNWISNLGFILFLLPVLLPPSAAIAGVVLLPIGAAGILWGFVLLVRENLRRKGHNA